MLLRFPPWAFSADRAGGTDVHTFKQVHVCGHMSVCVHTYLAHNFSVCTYMDTWVHFSRISVVIFRPFLHVVFV